MRAVRNEERVRTWEEGALEVGDRTEMGERKEVWIKRTEGGRVGEE